MKWLFLSICSTVPNLASVFMLQQKQWNSKHLDLWQWNSRTQNNSTEIRLTEFIWYDARACRTYGFRYNCCNENTQIQSVKIKEADHYMAILVHVRLFRVVVHNTVKSQSMFEACVHLCIGLLNVSNLPSRVLQNEVSLFCRFGIKQNSEILKLWPWHWRSTTLTILLKIGRRISFISFRINIR